jgi:hypothetical protein
MRRRPLIRCLLAAGLATLAALAAPALTAVAGGAGPEQCLAQADNAAVAQCANRFAPGAVAPRTGRARAPATSPGAAGPVRADDGTYQLIPFRRAEEAGERDERVPIDWAADHSAQMRVIAYGALGTAVLGALGGAGIWLAARRRKCAYCGAGVGAAARVCPQCFRAA